MKKRSAPKSSPPVGDASTTIEPLPKRSKQTRTPKSDLTRTDPIPPWLNNAASTFVNATPTLNWTGGFYSWGTWLEQLRSPHLWTTLPISNSSSSPSKLTQTSTTGLLLPPWRALIGACRKSGQVCGGTAALCRAKSDLVSAIINLVYRRGEQQRLADKSQQPASERDVMRRVRAVVTRQRRHEAVALTLIRYLDLAFVFSAYKDCRLATIDNDIQLKRNLPNINNNSTHDAESGDVEIMVEQELLFFESKPAAQDIRAVTTRMQTFMWQKRWLPWYEQIPGVRDPMVIHAREAAWSFCHGLPFPELHVRAGVRGLSRDHIAGAGSMNEWLLSLFHPRLVNKWAILAEVYEKALNEGLREEEPLLEETARRVVERVLEPLTEMHESADSQHSKLVDAAPGIVVTQSLKIGGRFTFRQVLELYIKLAKFGSYLHSTFYAITLPSIEQIHSGIMLFDEIRSRTLEVRPLIEADRVDRLYEWCLATTESHSKDGHESLADYGGCIAYQHAAIRAALGSAITLLPGRRKAAVEDEFSVTENDPLVFAAVIAQWDAPLASRMVDASLRIGRIVRNKFQNGKGSGLDLYTHRRVMVCQAVRDRFRGDVKMAARVMSRMHAVWDVCVSDKGIGKFDGRGAMALKMAVDKGNFEAASVFGLLLCCPEWEQRRRACNLEMNVDTGLVHICRAVALGDTASAADLLHVLSACSLSDDDDDGDDVKKNGMAEAENARGRKLMVVSKRTVGECLQCLIEASLSEESVSLFLGFLYSQGVAGVPANCAAAVREYERVLLSNSTTTQYRAFAANNLGVLSSFMNIGKTVGGNNMREKEREQIGQGQDSRDRDKLDINNDINILNSSNKHNTKHNTGSLSTKNNSNNNNLNSNSLSNNRGSKNGGNTGGSSNHTMQHTYHANQQQQVGSDTMAILPSVDEMNAKDLFRLASRAGVHKAASNLAAVLCHGDGRQTQHGTGSVNINGNITNGAGSGDVKAAREMYGQLFHSPIGDAGDAASPVTVIQTDYECGVTRFFQLDVRRDRQEHFCRDLKPSDMRVEHYGKIMQQESIPFVYDSPADKSASQGQMQVQVQEGPAPAHVVATVSDGVR